MDDNLTGLSIAPDTQPDPISLNYNRDVSDAPSEETAESRADKIHYGLGSILNQSKDEIKKDLMDGKESQIRQRAAATLDAQNEVNKQKSIQNYLTNSTGALSPEYLDQLLGQNAKPIEPSSVIERAFGNAAINTIGGSPGTLDKMNEAKEQLPDTTAAVQEAGSDMAAKITRIDTLMKDTQDLQKKQGWDTWLGDKAVNFIPLWEQLHELGLTGILAGNTADQHSFETLSKPFDDFNKTVTDNAAAIPNLDTRLNYLSHVKGQTSDEKLLNNLGTIMDVASIPGTGLAGRLARGLFIRNEVINATRDVVQHMAVSEPTKAVILNAAGDSAEAGVKKAASDIIDMTKGEGGVFRDPTKPTAAPDLDVTKRALEDLPEYLRLDGDRADIRPGRGGTEIALRINDMLTTTEESWLSKLITAARVERVPELEDNLRDLLDDKRSDWKGPANAIQDIRYMGKDPVSNTHWLETQLVRSDGTPFEDPLEAAAWGRANGIVTHAEPTTMFAEASKYAEARLAIIENEIQKAQEHISSFPTHGGDIEALLRTTDDMTAARDKLAGLEQQKREVQAYKMDHSIGPNINIPGVDGFKIKPQGLGYYISLLEPVDEHRNVVRQSIGTTLEGQLPISWTNGVFAQTLTGGYADYLRTPAETFSSYEKRQRLIATHTPSILLDEADKASKPIQRLKGKSWKEWEKVVDTGRRMMDPDTNKPGFFYRDPAEFDNAFYQINGRYATEAEQLAYTSFKQFVEMNRGYSTVAEFRNKSRLGVQQHNFTITDSNGGTIESPFFEGKVHKGLPGGEDGVYVPGEKLGQGKTYASNDPQIKKLFEEKEKQGQVRVLELWDPERRPFDGFVKNPKELPENARVRYVIVPGFNTKPLDWATQVNRTGGGHFIYDYNHYIKQANVQFDPITKKFWYEGDRTVMPIAIHSDGVEVAKHMDIVRELIKENRLKEAEVHHNQYIGRESWKDHKSWYFHTKAPDGTINPPRLSKEEPFYVVHNNMSIMDTDSTLKDRYTDPVTLHPSLNDGTRRGSLARQNSVDYNRERDSYHLMTINDRGSQGNPLGSYEPAKMLDVVPTMHRAMNKAVNDTFMEDYKNAAVERWIRMGEDAHAFKADTADYRRSPFYFFQHPDELYVRDIDPVVKANLENTRFKINQFIGTQSEAGKYMQRMSQSLSDGLSTIAPDKIAVVPLQTLPLVTNIPAKARSLVTHLKMGLFAVPQMFTQLSTALNVLAIGGMQHAPGVTMATLLHQFARLDGSAEFLQKMDDWMTKLPKVPGFSSYKPGEWLEANKTLHSVTGFQNVGTEHALMDAAYSNKVIKNSWGTFLDMGMMPFKYGAENTRIAAHYMAMKEFREGAFEGKTFTGVPVVRRGSEFGALTDRDVGSIMDRASDLDHNMSRAASSPLHTNWMSFALQFAAYPLRLAELMWGKRLTAGEKTRLFAVSSIMYGLPAGGLGLYGYPMADYLYNKAKENGFWGLTKPYIPGQNWFYTAMMDGVPALAGAMITGGGDTEKGTVYDIKKWAAKGIDASQEGDLLKLFGGSALSTGYGWYKESTNFRHGMWNILTGSQTEFPLTSDDYTAILREASGFNDMRKMLLGIQYHKLMSKNNTWVGDVSTPGAILNGLVGLQDVRAANVSGVENVLKARRENQEWGIQNFEPQMNLHFMALANNDPEQAEKYMKKAKGFFVLVDLPLEKRSTALRQAFTNNESLIQKLDKNFYTKDVPESQQMTLEQAYEKTLQIEQKKGER